MSPYQGVDLFASLEAPRAPCRWDFMEASSWYDQLLTPLPAPVEDGA